MREEEEIAVGEQTPVLRQLESNVFVPSYPENWPTTVQCEMDVDAWERALDNAGLLPEYEDVLRGFRGGFDQGIPDHTISDQPFFTPKNHTSSLLVSDKINLNIFNEVKSRRMLGPFSHKEVSKIYPFY